MFVQRLDMRRRMPNEGMDLLETENKGILPTPMQISVWTQEIDRSGPLTGHGRMGIVSTATQPKTMSSCLEFVIFNLINAELKVKKRYNHLAACSST